MPLLYDIDYLDDREEGLLPEDAYIDVRRAPASKRAADPQPSAATEERNPDARRYLDAIDRQRAVEMDRPARPQPKWWQRLAAGAAGAAVGYSKASGHNRDLDVGQVTEGILAPGHRGRLADWAGRVEGARADTGAEKQRLSTINEIRRIEAEERRAAGRPTPPPNTYEEKLVRDLSSEDPAIRAAAKDTLHKMKLRDGQGDQRIAIDPELGKQLKILPDPDGKYYLPNSAAGSIVSSGTQRTNAPQRIEVSQERGKQLQIQPDQDGKYYLPGSAGSAIVNSATPKTPDQPQRIRISPERAKQLQIEPDADGNYYLPAGAAGALVNAAKPPNTGADDRARENDINGLLQEESPMHASRDLIRREIQAGFAINKNTNEKVDHTPQSRMDLQNRFDAISNQIQGVQYRKARVLGKRIPPQSIVDAMKNGESRVIAGQEWEKIDGIAYMRFDGQGGQPPAQAAQSNPYRQPAQPVNPYR